MKAKTLREYSMARRRVENIYSDRNNYPIIINKI